ncbi:hypothetical protein T265_09732 [Opisthorchis viverrini]|uniref:Exocyst complex component 5 n=1 Tax=Opisthorchis viverrini TaxID=6198 RepID=A0A075A3W4_OPIVI|nr:hypothetical protein T265_09732 [Opisthorchis viverrini]KER22079.1 hypothetical protein T265_09732 [Opisthorchis viverrini]
MEEQFNQHHGVTARTFSESQRVLVRDYSGRHPTWTPGLILCWRGTVVYEIRVGPAKWIRHANRNRPTDSQILPTGPSDMSLEMLLDNFDLGTTPENQSVLRQRPSLSTDYNRDSAQTGSASHCVSPGGVAKNDISIQIGKARAAFANLRHQWRRRDISFSVKGRVYNAAVRSILLYGSDTWPLRAEDVKRLLVFDLQVPSEHCPNLGTNHGVALIDRLTKSTVGIPSSETDLKPRKLIENFGIALHELLILKAKLEDRSLQLEAKCRLDERSFRITIERLRKELTELHDQFSKLDTQVHMVSGKLAHLGDQLERKNLPRKRIEEARDLILEFYKFLGAGGGTFANVAVNLQGDETQLLEAAKRIKNLNSLCFELPDDERFLSAKQRVTVAHQQLEATLLERFRINCAERNTAMMKSIADALINSKGHTTCMEILIEETLKGINSRNLDFEAMTTRLVAAEQDIMEVFSRPEATLMQLINSLFTYKLKPHMDERIRSDMSSEMYLINLYTEYQNMDKLMKALCDRLTLVTDPSQLSRLFRELFANYLSQYVAREKECLTRRLKKHLDQFYEARGHQKRPLTSSGIADFKRDLRVKLHMLPDQRSMVDFEGSLLSEEVAVNIIEDIRRAAKRCLVVGDLLSEQLPGNSIVHSKADRSFHTSVSVTLIIISTPIQYTQLSQPTEFAANGMALFDILNEFLVVEHVRYGVVIALQGLQTMDARTVTPNIVFFSVVRDCTSIIQFFGKTVDESIFPLVSASPTCLQEINSKRQSIQQKLEAQLQSGLDRCLNLIISHVQHVLSTEQRKTDFRPDSAVGIPVGGPPSQACQRVVGFLAQVVNEARRQLDGQNLKNFFTELGMRLNRTLVDHFYGFTFSDTGGFLAMQDVTAYRDLASQFGSPVVHGLFDVLLKLMNLMLIKPDNVQQVSQDYLQSGIPLELLQNFIQLRADYKEARVKMEIRKPSR